MNRLIVLLILFATGCQVKNGFPVSKDQAVIENMTDSFSVDYKSAPTYAAKDLVLNRYHSKIGNYLLDHYMNHIRIHVDSMQMDTMGILMKFHSSKNVAFVGTLTFTNHMPHKENSLVHFMESLKPGTDTSLDFVYLGKIELNPANESPKPVLLIYALPISFQKHAL